MDEINNFENSVLQEIILIIDHLLSIHTNGLFDRWDTHFACLYLFFVLTFIFFNVKKPPNNFDNMRFCIIFTEECISTVA